MEDELQLTLDRKVLYLLVLVLRVSILLTSGDG